jgi:hypothetical protein
MLDVHEEPKVGVDPINTDEPGDRYPGFSLRIHGDHDQLSVLLQLLVEQRPEFTELRAAVGSPKTTVEDEYYVLVSPELGQGDVPPAVLRQGEVRRDISYHDPLNVRRWQVASIRGADRLCLD